MNAESVGTRATVLIPARNEAASIVRCLEQVLAQDLPLEELEVVVVDGSSTDGTADLARSVLEGSGVGGWTVVTNPGGATPSNLNAGLRHVTSEVVCRVDARSLIPTGYVRRCVEILSSRPEVAVVGGAQVAVARSSSANDLGIARALNNRLAMGLARYRRGAASGPSDTVYLGAFRTAELRAVGGWDLRLATNQDFDLNRRMTATGMVWFEEGIDVGYLPRESIARLFSQYRRFGRWKAAYWALSGERPRPRQIVLLALPAGAAIGAAVGLRRRPGVTAAFGLAALAGVELAAGTTPRRVGPGAHLVAVLAIVAVGGGWWSGAVEGLVAERFRRPGRLGDG
ncbi:MAG: glycosyltransferase [Acidimicrobiales bacterium]|jgi:glycosyltransferase involved in cell wall biosynthesis|nr:glycosyltransferase [Acidimicrobiales bacterium]